MTKSYLEWIDDSVLEAAAQYVVNRVQHRLRNKSLVLMNVVTQAFQTELIPTLDYSHALAFDRLERSLPLFHRQVIGSLPGWSWQSPEGMTIDLVNVEQNMYVELRTYFRYQYGTSYIDRLADMAEAARDKNFYLVFVNGIAENDINPARDRIELTNPLLENLFVISLEDLYSKAVGRDTAIDELTQILPKLLSNISPHSLPAVFISYSRQNTSDMKKIKAVLLQHGIPAWTDELLQPGTPDWQLAIEDALETAACVLLVLSPEAKKSTWVRNELNYARENGVDVVPFWIAGTSNEVAMLNLVTTQRIDARQPELREVALNQTIDVIERYIQRKLTQTDD